MIPYGKGLILKALSWELISTSVMTGLAWVMFGQIKTCVVFSAIGFIVKTGLFIVHDKFWSRFEKGPQ